jgi:homoserine kinase
VRMPSCAFTFSVPATTANLCPGFDAVGVALRLRSYATITSASRFGLTFVRNSCAPTHDGVAEAIVRAARSVANPLPRIKLHIDNRIPLGKGLGSSAAAAVLGIAAALHARNQSVSRRLVARLACEIEGHPDNALAAVFGGGVIAASHERGCYVRVPMPAALRVLVVIPDIDLPTSRSRALLPWRYRSKDVVFNAQRAALLGATLASGSWRHLREAMRDRIHQPYRSLHIPGMDEALSITHRDAFGVALSGAGPSLIVFLRTGALPERVARRFTGCFDRVKVRTRLLLLRCDARGLIGTVGGRMRNRNMFELGHDGAEVLER